MKIYKKIGLGLILVGVLASGLLMLTHAKPALAATSQYSGSVTPDQLDKATYKVISKNEIDGVINGKTIPFIYNSLTDPSFAGLTTYKPVSGPFCGNTVVGKGGTNGLTLNLSFDALTQSTTSIDGAITYDYLDASGKCQSYSNQLTFKQAPDGSLTATESVAACDNSSDATCATPASSSDCVFSTNGGGWESDLNWILCPLVRGLSSSADTVNGFVSGQLNFDIQGNLPDGGSVQKAWATFKDLASAIIVIILLIMVISQAIGGGVFDAYTVKKMLPKLVAAVILMQISWYLCTYLIGLANDLGQGLAQLMAAPFGGLSALELGPLLQRLGGVWAAISGVGLEAGAAVGLIGAIFFAGPLIALGWPIAVLALLMIVIAVIVACATLLVRNALIILLVILSPLAFIAWVLPGLETYWKMWKNNFTRLLVFFPLVIALIYGGRIFAWVAGGLGDPGPLDLVMVLVGFFAPYFFLPKSFKWGGTFLASASKAVSESWPARKSKEVASRELLAAQKRSQNRLVDQKYKSMVFGKDGKDPTRAERFKGALTRGLVRSASGHAIPTHRSTQVMMQEAGKWKEEEIGLTEGKINNDYKEFQKGDPDNGVEPMSVQQAKEAVRNKYYTGGKDAFQDRAFFTWAYDTKSFMEMGQDQWRQGYNTDPVTGKAMPPKDKDGNDAPYQDMVKTQGWIDFLHGNSGAYSDFGSRLGAFVPYRLPRGGGPKGLDYLPEGYVKDKQGRLNSEGKRYELLGQEFEMEDKVVTDANGNETIRKVISKDADGNDKRNKFYNPGLKHLIDTKDPRATHLAERTADSERFMKTIDQAEDPAAIPALRPEQFEELKKISAELEVAGISSPGKVRLGKFIDEQSQTLAGRNLLQRLSGAAEVHVDQMLGPHYLANALEDPGAKAARERNARAGAQPTNQPQEQSSQSQATNTGGGNTGGGGSGSGGGQQSPSGGQRQQHQTPAADSPGLGQLADSLAENTAATNKLANQIRRRESGGGTTEIIREPIEVPRGDGGVLLIHPQQNDNVSGGGVHLPPGVQNPQPRPGEVTPPTPPVTPYQPPEDKS